MNMGRLNLSGLAQPYQIASIFWLRYLVVADRHSFGRFELHNLRDFRNLKLLVLPHTRSGNFAATTQRNTLPPEERRQWYENAIRAKL
jgi:hypothetical protein